MKMWSMCGWGSCCGGRCGGSSWGKSSALRGRFAGRWAESDMVRVFRRGRGRRRRGGHSRLMTNHCQSCRPITFLPSHSPTHPSNRAGLTPRGLPYLCARPGSSPCAPPSTANSSVVVLAPSSARLNHRISPHLASPRIGSNYSLIQL